MHGSDELSAAEAKENFQGAVDSFLSETVQQVQHLSHELESGLKNSIEEVTQTLLTSIRKIKAELNVVEAVRQDPMTWVAGAAAIGAVTTLTAYYLGKSRGRWLLYAGEMGLALLQSERRNKKSQPVIHH